MFKNLTKYIIFILINYKIYQIVYAACAIDEFECDNHTCIDRYSACDGPKDCSDGSDEIAENCMDTECPSFSFRCTFGGCISGNARCNGKIDCADGSDEMELLCKYTTPDTRKRKIEGRCGSNRYECKSGDCIDLYDICDGQIHCNDGSDEILEICSTWQCASPGFRCGNGACVIGSARCDGVKQCADGSDEAAIMCKTPRLFSNHTNTFTTPSTPSTSTWSIITPPTFISPTSTSTSTSATLADGCKLTPNVIAKTTDGHEYHYGDILPQFKPITFTCESNHVLRGSTSSICLNGVWNKKIPSCSDYCDKNKIDYGYSTEARCYDSNQYKYINCSDKIEPGVKVRITCAPGFTQPYDFNHEIICWENGRWDQRKKTCEMECGVKAVRSIQLSKNSENVQPSELPWHARIYSSFGDEFKFNCGGTIISPFIILSAAHCFWDEANDVKISEIYYKVVVGKLYTDYNKIETESFEKQERNIQEIFIPAAFNNLRNNKYDADLAIVVLEKYIRFGKDVRPICITYREFARKEIDFSTSFIGGSGISDNNQLSTQLQLSRMHAKTNYACRDYLQTSNFAGYSLENDKFCLINDIGITLCKGDSGGGVYSNRDNKHFLEGIISHTPFNEQDCASKGSVVAVTNIQFYSDIIDEYKKNYSRYDSNLKIRN